MSEMIRKQFYIHKRHQILLTKLARAKGVSEAEIIRRAIEHEAIGNEAQTLSSERTAWEAVLATVEARKSLSEQGEAYKWNRQDAYQERENHFYSKPQ